jgi:DNA polymerase-3 subunit delta'
LEEPGSGTIFALTAPQRERLLPTLVSRSWSLTLPWPRSGQDNDPRLAEWMPVLEDFMQTGRGWMGRTASRGAVDERLAGELLLLLQRSLVQTLKGEESPLVGLRRLSPKNRRLLYEALAECQESLLYRVNPGLAADWLATRLFLMYAQDREHAAP